MLKPTYSIELDQRQRAHLRETGYCTVLCINTNMRRHFRVRTDMDYIHSKAKSLRKAHAPVELIKNSFVGVIALKKGVDINNCVDEDRGFVIPPENIGQAKAKSLNPLDLWFVYTLPLIQLISRAAKND